MAKLLINLIGLQLIMLAGFCLVVSKLWPEAANYQDAPWLGQYLGLIGMALLIGGVAILLIMPALEFLGNIWPHYPTAEQEAARIKGKYLENEKNISPTRDKKHAVRRVGD